MAEPDEREIEPGTPEFDHMVFKLTKPLNDDNLATFNYNDDSFQKIQENVYVMPAYVEDKFNLFFVAAPLVDDDWIIAFSEATIENENEITDLSEPMPTGKGLNLLAQRSPLDANQILKYFNTLIDAGYGEWKLVK